ncbi:MAG: hypothetical protein EAX95_10490 [Candidatus Thorarchaeota archaeon]|nr:hypothetical protein [Candidatus Thorarchaeota archaeon]
MSDPEIRILRLTSVALTREKQLTLQDELERYASSVNFVIKTIMQKHITKVQKTIETVQDSFSARFDSRPEYLRDVVRTARVEIGKHRRMARTIRTMRGKTPYFKSGRMILSHPLVSIDEKSLVLRISGDTELPIPFDKHSRNQNANELLALSRGTSKPGRIRITWNKQGYADVDVRLID